MINIRWVLRRMRNRNQSSYDSSSWYIQHVERVYNAVPLSIVYVYGYIYANDNILFDTAIGVRKEINMYYNKLIIVKLS